MLVRKRKYAHWMAAPLAVAWLVVASGACDRNTGEPPERAVAEGEAPRAEAPAPEPYVPEGPLGAIEGRVVLEGDAPERVPLRRGSDPFCARTEMLSETVVASADGGLQDVFVRVHGEELKAPPSREPVVIDQTECMYRPRVQGAVAGQTLRVKNSDATLHNVHAREMTLERGAGPTLYNLAQPAGSGDIEQPIAASEVLELRCDLHSWMRAFVIVSDHPHFATTEEDGRFRIDNVPVGTYELQLWHELYGAKTVEVIVEEGETAEVELSYDAEADRPT
jgi:plastocyanin